MANSDRDIRIVPDRGASTAPAMYFTGADSLSSATIVLRVFNSSTDATLSFEGDVGQLFSITDSTFGPVFSVNDISGIPSIEVLDSGLIKLAEWNGKVQIGGANNNENATSTATGELQVIGGVGVSKDVYVGGGMTVVGTLNAAVVTGSISNSANVAVTNDTASSTAQYLTFVSGTSGNLPIKVDSSALTFVPSTNNLGIGTTTPYSRLSLVSSAVTEGISLFTSAYEAGRQWGHRIWKNDVGGGIPLQFDVQQTTTWYTTIRMSHGQDNNHPALITYYNTQLAMTSGNVGVGITPTNKLHVSGDSKVAGTFVGLRNYQSGDDFRIDFVKAANDTASARFEWNGYSAATTHLIDYFSIGLNDASSVMQTRFQIMQDGRIGLNTTDFAYTSSDNTAVVAGGIDANKVFVNGSIQLLGNNNAIVFGRGTGSFMKDEELGFGWGGGWYMTDTTYLRSRNNKHVYNEAEFSGSKFQGYSTSYNKESFLVPRWNDNDWAFGIASNDSSFYWLQGRYYGDGTNNRGFRIKNSNGGAIVFAVNEKVIATQNTIYGTWQSYTGSDNGPMKTWDGVLVAGSDNTSAATYTVIETNVPQDSYMMGGFTINWFENYSSTNAKTKIEIAGYWNPASNGGHIGFEYTSSNPGISPTIQVGRNTSNGKTVFVLTHFSSNYAIIVARDLWLGYSGGSYDYGSGWTMSQTSSLAAYSNLVGVVARTVSASGGAGSGINADLLDGIDSTGFVFNGTTTNGSININGGTANAANDGTVYITATNNNDWGLIVNKYNASATEYGVDIRMGAASAYALRVQGNGADKMRINGEGQIFSPIYYDYNDNTYYGDFASTSRLNILNLAGYGYITGQTSNGQSFYQWEGATYRNPGDHTPSLLIRADNAATGINGFRPALALYNNNGSNQTTIGLSFVSLEQSGSGNSVTIAGIIAKKEIAGTSGNWTDGSLNFFVKEGGTRRDGMFIDKTGFVQSEYSFRSPIFYDSNDTAFYVNPNGTSRIRRTDLIASGAGWDDGLNLYSADQTNRWNLLVDNGAADSLRFAYNNSEALSINTSRNVTANVDIRAPIFYDSNNTAFYADPASTSRFNAIIANSINIPGSGGGSSNEYVFNCTASATQARRFEIARIGIDYNDWNSVGGFEVELHENYFGSGLIKKYTVYYGYVSNFGVHLTHYSGSGSNQFRVTTSGEVTVSGDHRYISVFVDVDYYSGVTATVRTTRNITTSNPPPVGSTFIFSTPTITNIAGFTADSIVFVPTTVQAGGDFRAPIFYDSNDTTYYVNPATDSVLNYLTLRNNTALFFSNSATAELNHNSNSTSVAFAMIKSGTSFADSDSYGVLNLRRTNHNNGATTAGASLFFELKDSGGTVREYAGISGRKTEAGAAGGQLDFHNYNRNIVANLNSSLFQHSSSVRAPIFYDSNNTSYYTDPASTSVLYRVDINNNVYFTNFGRGMIGTYSASRYQAVFAMGDAYKLPDDGTSPSNLYGIAWSHPNAGGVASNLNTHGALIMENGTFLAALSGSIRSRDDMRAPIFYDSNNTAYYVDPAGTSVLNIINANTINASGGAIVLPQNPVGQGYSGVVTQPTYYIGQASGGDDGWKMYSESPSGTNTGALILQSEDDFDGNESIRLRFKRTYTPFNTTDSLIAYYNYVTVGGSIRAPLFYDTDDTSYYVDPHSTSYQRSLFLGAHDSGTSEFRFGEDSSGWYGDRWYWDSSYTTYRYSRFAGTDSLIHYHDTRDTTRITYGRNIVFDNYGKGIVGTYDSTRLQGVFSMGDAYKLPADGSTAGTLYGLAWSHPNAGTKGGANNLNDHGLLLINNGTFRAAISSRAVFSADVRGTLFYDYNDTGYYLDPASTSNLNTVNIATLNVGGSAVVTGSRYRWSTGYFNDGTTTAAFVADLSQNGHLQQGFTTHKAPWDYAGNSDVDTGLGIIEMAGCAVSTWHDGSYYTSLVIRPTTGAGGGGVYIYNDQGAGYSPGWRQVWTSSTTNYNYADVRAPVYYDVYDTSYYVDPNGESRQARVRVGPYAGSTTAGNVTGLELVNNGGTGDSNVAAMSFHCAGQYAVHLHLRADSYFGMGGWSASAWRWYVQASTGNMTAAGEVTAYSDPRLKENIEKIASPLERISKLRGVRFKWKDISVIGNPGSYDYGVIANEVEEQFPELVYDSAYDAPEGDKYKTVAYSKFAPILIEAIKEQQTTIDSLSDQVTEQQTTIDSLSNQVKELTALVQNLINKSINT